MREDVLVLQLVLVFSGALLIVCEHFSSSGEKYFFEIIAFELPNKKLIT
jgi:hypothetical protein